MKICITSEGKSMDSAVDPRFGRCAFFVFFDTDTESFEVEDNSSVQAEGGAGIKAGQIVISKGAKTVLTGNVGPNAYEVLSAAGIGIVTGVSGTIRDAIWAYRAGVYKPVSSPSVGSKFGTNGN